MTERFVFEKEKIDILRRSVTSASDESAVEDPTRVELVSGFIWKHIMAARLKNGKSTRKMYAALHALIEPFPIYLFLSLPLASLIDACPSKITLRTA